MYLVGGGVGKMPPLCFVGFEAALFHNILQKLCIFRRFCRNVAEVQICRFRKIIEIGRHFHWRPVKTKERYIHGAATGMRGIAHVRIGNVSGIGADIPQLPLRRCRTPSIPNHQTITGICQFFANRSELLDRSVAETRCRFIINDLSREVIGGGISDIQRRFGQIVG